MKKYNYLFIVISLCCSSLAKGQGLIVGIGTGTSLFKLEGGYSFQQNQILANFTPGFADLTASELGIGFRHTFEENDLGNSMMKVSMRLYLGAGLGVISTPELTETIYLSNYPYSTTKITPSESLLGYNVNGGVEILYGSSGKFGSYIEILGGQVPSYISAMLSNSYTSNFGFMTGLRIYL